MRTLLSIVAVTTALIWGGLTLVSAENARFRFLAAVYGDTAGPGLHLPEGVACGPGGLVIVADTGNDRLLVWNAVPAASGQAANTGMDLRTLTFELPAWFNTATLTPRRLGTWEGRVYVGQLDRVLVLPDLWD